MPPLTFIGTGDLKSWIIPTLLSVFRTTRYPMVSPSGRQRQGGLQQSQSWTDEESRLARIEARDIGG
jgi:hypothetical protein